jgi:hypothetical protein
MFRKAVSLGLIVALATPPALLAQTTQQPVRGSWDSLKAIPPGDELVVEQRGRGAVKGRLSGVSDTALTLTRGRTPTDVSRADALKIYRLTPKSHKKAMLIGLGVGAGIGGGIGGSIVAGGGESGESWPIALLGGVGAAFGALGGYLIGRGKRKDLIYESR